MTLWEILGEILGEILVKILEIKITISIMASLTLSGLICTLIRRPVKSTLFFQSSKSLWDFLGHGTHLFSDETQLFLRLPQKKISGVFATLKK